MNDNAKGISLGALGVLLISPDSLILRLIDCDDYAVVVVRALMMAVVIAVLIILFPRLRRGFRWRPLIHYGLWVGLGIFCFPLSIKNTHVANTLVILAVAPILAAVGAWIFLNERISRPTWAAAAAVGLGVGVIFADKVSGSGLLGDFLALITALSLAACSIIIRKNQDIAFVPGLIIGAVLSALLFLPFADWTTVDRQDALWMLVNGAVIMPFSYLLITAASRLLLPPEVNLLFLLETALGPLWVWLVLTEAPPVNTMLAGALVIGIVLLHSAWVLRRLRNKPLAAK